jgi:hypothetical protein
MLYFHPSEKWVFYRVVVLLCVCSIIYKIYTVTVTFSQEGIVEETKEIHNPDFIMPISKLIETVFSDIFDTLFEAITLKTIGNDSYQLNVNEDMLVQDFKGVVKVNLK